MKKFLPLLIVTIVIVFVVFVVALSNNSNNKTSQLKPQENNNIQEPVNNPVVDDANPSEPEEEKKIGKYIAYSSNELTTGTNIIFFAASWCPSCKELDSDIQKNIGKIPSNLTILKADYDKEQDLKVKYGVTIQHTLVRVDKNGNMLNKWTGLYTLSTLNDVLALLK